MNKLAKNGSWKPIIAVLAVFIIVLAAWLAWYKKEKDDKSSKNYLNVDSAKESEEELGKNEETTKYKKSNELDASVGFSHSFFVEDQISMMKFDLHFAHPQSIDKEMSDLKSLLLKDMTDIIKQDENFKEVKNTKPYSISAITMTKDFKNLSIVVEKSFDKCTEGFAKSSSQEELKKWIKDKLGKNEESQQEKTPTLTRSSSRSSGIIIISDKSESDEESQSSNSDSARSLYIEAKNSGGHEENNLAQLENENTKTDFCKSDSGSSDDFVKIGGQGDGHSKTPESLSDAASTASLCDDKEDLESYVDGGLNNSKKRHCVSAEVSSCSNKLHESSIEEYIASIFSKITDESAKECNPCDDVYREAFKTPPNYKNSLNLDGSILTSISTPERKNEGIATPDKVILDSASRSKSSSFSTSSENLTKDINPIRRRSLSGSANHQTKNGSFVKNISERFENREAWTRSKADDIRKRRSLDLLESLHLVKGEPDESPSTSIKGGNCLAISAVSDDLAI